MDELGVRVNANFFFRPGAYRPAVIANIAKSTLKYIENKRLGILYVCLFCARSTCFLIHVCVTNVTFSMKISQLYVHGTGFV